MTFLAFANGAPDLFSLFSAVQNGPETASMAFGAAFGAGLFVTTVVVALIIFVQPFQFKRRPFVRDTVLYLAAVGVILALFTHGEMTLLGSVGLVVLYALYVLVVAVSHMIYKSEFFQRVDPLRRKVSVAALDAETIPLMKKEHTYLMVSKQVVADYGFDQDSFGVNNTGARELAVTPFMEAVTPMPADEWDPASCPGRAVLAIRSPLLLILKITTPVINATKEETWCKPLYALQLLVAPITVLYLTSSDGEDFGSIPDWAAALLIGASFAVLTLLVLPGDRPPFIYKWLSVTGFIVSVVWVYIVADMAVDLLSTLGVLCGVSDALIGLLVMGLGNSVGDLAANIAVARNGFPAMAVSACFGAPAMNMLLGIGGAYLYIIVQTGSTVIFEDSIDRLQLQMSAFFLLGVLGFMVVYILCRNFYADRILGTLLIATYAAFLVTTISIEIENK